MNIIQRIAKNTIVLLAARVIEAILSLVLFILIARSLGDVTFGKFSFAIAFTAIFAVFLDLGYNALIIRQVSRDKSQANKYLSNILSMRALISIIIFTLIVLTLNLMEYPEYTKNVIYLFAIYTILVSLSAAFKVTFRAFEKMEYEAGITILTNIIRVTLVALLLFLGYNLIEIAFVYVLSGAFDVLLSLFFCEKNFLKGKIELDLGFWKRTIRIALPLSILSIFSLIYIRVDTIMLSIMKGDAVVGWYNAAYKLVLGFKPLPHLFMNSLFPLMAGYYISSKASLKIMYEKSFKYLFILGLPLAVSLTLLSDRFIILFYGEQFIPAIPALKILAWDILLKFLFICTAFILISIDKQNRMIIVAGCTAFLNVILNIILIPNYSYIGAAIATIVSEGFLLVSYIYLNTRYISTIPLHKFIPKSIIACGVMAFFIYQFNEINLILLIIVSIILYFGALYLLKGFSGEDLTLFKQLFRR